MGYEVPEGHNAKAHAAREGPVRSGDDPSGAHSTDGAKKSGAAHSDASTPALTNLIDFGGDEAAAPATAPRASDAGPSGRRAPADDVFDPFADLAGDAGASTTGQQQQPDIGAGLKRLHISGAATAPATPHRRGSEPDQAASDRDEGAGDEDEEAGPSTPGHDLNSRRELVSTTVRFHLCDPARPARRLCVAAVLHAGTPRQRLRLWAGGRAGRPWPSHPSACMPHSAIGPALCTPSALPRPPHRNTYCLACTAILPPVMPHPTQHPATKTTTAPR